MDFEEMLRPKICSCGREHCCEIKRVDIGSGILSRITETTKSYRHILLVADENTYSTCGAQVEATLGSKLEADVVFPGDTLLVPNESAIEAIQGKLTANTDLLLGIGSGVIQDLCKYVSFEAGHPYHIIATAPSMDGYASKGAAMILSSMKVTVNAHVPEVILADLDILKNAPMALIQSGYGDILGKFSCLNDWKLSSVVNGEYFCPVVYGMVEEMLQSTKDLGPKLLSRDPEAIGRLMEALIGVGIAMAYVGNSRPASGSEHHLSHFFEITGLLNNEFYFMHGTDVAYSAVYTQKLREALLALDAPIARGGHTRKDWEAAIRSIYTDAAEGVIALQEKLGWYRQDRLPIYKEKWPHIKEILGEVPSSEALSGYLASVGLPMEDFEQAYSPEKIQNALFYAKDLKDRYTVLWLYYDLMR
ncbi:MAG: sn-glycerol-1-phosphate dehydrogenase [Oscillospiraceae bacterium]|nr:sn-glycerol-1-phosphate dehydrogenase [Oscillospiraceae bacterium]